MAGFHSVQRIHMTTAPSSSELAFSKGAGVNPRFFSEKPAQAMIKMLPFALIPSFAQQTAPVSGGGGFNPTILLFYGLIMAAMWFLLIAPQRKKQKEQQKMISSLASGDEVLLTGGIYGEITSVRPDRLVVRISENTKVEVEKGFIHTVVRKSGQTDDKK
jgi:preprotein translocase subunit YajC